MMGTLFLTVLAFVNLWGYTELEAALAITPVAVTAMIVSPLVGRLSQRIQPRWFALPALIVMAVGMLSLATLPAEPSVWAALWRLTLVGLGVGATFPAVSIGSMGSIRGQELGLGSGIVNMARQVGFAIGVALFVAVFTGTIGSEVRDAREQVTALVRERDLTPAERSDLERSAFANPSDPSVARPEPRTPLQQQAREIVDEEVRDAYGAAFRVGGLVVLLAVPFSLQMRQRPGEVGVPAPASAG
jgi:MFS family permease